MISVGPAVCCFLLAPLPFMRYHTCVHDQDVPVLAGMQWTMCYRATGLERYVESMVALGGDLYIYGGILGAGDRSAERDSDQVLSDVLVAKAKDGIVSLPWMRIEFSESAPPSITVPDLKTSTQSCACPYACLTVQLTQSMG